MGAGEGREAVIAVWRKGGFYLLTRPTVCDMLGVHEELRPLIHWRYGDWPHYLQLNYEICRSWVVHTSSVASSIV